MRLYLCLLTGNNASRKNEDAALAGGTDQLFPDPRAQMGEQSENTIEQTHKHRV